MNGNNPQQENAGKAKETFAEGFRRRMSENTTTRWIRFGVVMLLFVLWVAWMGNWWLLLAGLLLVDIYITGYIPFTWWKKSDKPWVRALMSWVDAIVYALVLVYFVFAFLGQNYQIPSSSLEKTLLTGDYLFVNKAVYGPRVPMTPVNFPLVHNELPFGLGKSYSDAVTLGYHRLKGMRQVEAGDIVVFNFPAGDTVAVKIQNPDYYTLCKMYGRDNVLSNPQTFGEIIYRPVDRRENYVKRAVGLPGERLKIVDGVIYINGEPIEQPEMVQFNYYYQLKNGRMSDETFDALGISADDRHMVPVGPDDVEALRQLGFTVNPDGTVPQVYASPLTSAMVKALEADPAVAKVMKMPATHEEYLYPEGVSSSWTRADYGEIWIPAKGSTLCLSPEAWKRYGRVIRDYEGNPSARLGEDGKVHIDGKPVDTYTFKMDFF